MKNPIFHRKYLWPAWLASVVFWIGCGIPQAHAITYVNRVGPNGEIREVSINSQTWVAANSPYVLEAKVNVNAGNILTVESGVTVQISSGQRIYVYGNLKATNATFTINGAGNWMGIYLSPDSGDSLLHGCTLQGAGGDSLGYFNGAYRRCAVYLDGCAANIVGCSIVDSASHGINLRPGGGQILNNTFQNVPAGYYAIACDHVNTFPTFGGNTASGAGELGIAVPGGGLSANITWTKPGDSFPYFLNGELSLNEGVEWNVAAGCVFKTEGQRVVIYGTLKALGTAGSPVLFTSRKTPSEAGDWRGLYFGEKAGASELHYVTLAYGGRDSLGWIRGAYRYTALFLDYSSPTFDHLTIQNSRYHGMEMVGSKAAFNNLAIQNCGGCAMVATAGSWPVLNTLNFTGNGKADSGYYAVYTEAGSLPTPANATFSDNKQQGIQVDGGSLAASGTWKHWAANAPYVVTKDMGVNQDVTLTIEQGATIKFANSGMYVGGTLLADGTPGRINFTSWYDDTLGGDSNGDGIATAPAGRNWKGIKFETTAGASLLNNCYLSYAGRDNMGWINGGYRLVTIYVDQSFVTVTNSIIANSGAHGIELMNSPARIVNNQFLDIADGYYAMVFDSLKVFPLTGGNTATGTGWPGIYVPGGTLNGTNTWNQPGANFPYFIGGDLTVAEDAELDLDAGNTVKTSNTRWLVYGTLQALGTAARPIVFTSSKPLPAPGDWRGLYMGPLAGRSKLGFVKVEFGGQDNLGWIHNTYRLAAMHLDSCSPAIDHLTISQSLWNGLELWACKSSIQNLSLEKCGGYALVAQAESRPSISTASFMGNGGKGRYTVYHDGSSVPDISGTTFASNQMQGIEVGGGSLTASGVWKNWSPTVPYVVTGNLTVTEGSTLTIEQGTTVKFQSTLLWVNGNLQANGNPGTIVFTSWRDDAAGGDSNGDGTNTVAQAGNWKGIYLAPTAGASVFNNCILRYAGGDTLGWIHNGYRRVTVYADGCSPTFTQCVISDSALHGLEFWASSAVVRNSQFANFGPGGYAMVCDTSDCQLQQSLNTFAGTGIPGISLPGGRISTPVTLQNPGTNFPYFLDSDLTVDEGATWRIAAGTTIKSAGRRIYVNGTLEAVGTAALPITFTSRQETPAAGDWMGLYFGPAAGNSRLAYVNLAYAGRDTLGWFNNAYRYATVYLNGSSPSLDHVTIFSSLWNGMELYNSQARINDITIRECGGHGLKAEAGSRPVIMRGLFAGNGYGGNGYYTVGTDGSSLPDPTAILFVTNKYSGIQIWGGTLGASGVYKNWQTNAPYVVTSDLTIGAGAVLSVEPNSTLKFQGAALYIQGTLLADGSAGQIHFTSAKDDAVGGDSNGDGTNTLAVGGDWKGIYLSPAAGDSAFKNCTFRYAGRDNLGWINNGYRYVTVYVDQCSPVFEQCAITDSSAHGIEMFQSHARLEGNYFNNFSASDYPVVLDSVNTFPEMKNNRQEGSGQGGIYVPGGSFGMNGVWSNPGTNFPYLLGGEVVLPETVSLTMEPGVEVRSGGPAVRIQGTLMAAGTAKLPIVFTSRNAAPTPGDWAGIYLGPQAGASQLSFCRVEFAGRDNLGWLQNAYRRSSIYVESSSPEMADLEVRSGAAHGVTLYNSNARLNNSLMYSNAWSAIMMFGGGIPQIINNTLAYSEGSGIYCYAGQPVIANNIVVFNTAAGITREGGDLTLNHNCIFGNTKANYQGVAVGATDLEVDPKFLDAAAGKYQLAGASPAVDAGDTSLIQPTWMDLDGRIRLQGVGVDIGAFEQNAPLAQHLVDALLKNPNEAVYTGAGTDSLAEQTKLQTVDAGTTAIYYFKLSYSGNISDDVRVVGGIGKAGWTVKYFDSLAGSGEITAAVIQGTYTWTNLAPGQAREMRVEVTPGFSAIGGTTNEVLLSFISTGEPTRLDTVRVWTVNQPKTGVDLMISRNNDIHYTGENIINRDAAGQVRSREIEPGYRAVYYLKVSNRGNIADHYIIRSLAPSRPWTVRFFDSLTSTNDVTDWVVGSGWTNAAQLLGASSEFRIEVNADSQATAGSQSEVLVTATSAADAGKVDAVKAVTLIAASSTTPQGRTYTIDADFDADGNATLVGVEYQTVHDQLQLSKQAVTLPFIWVPNSNDGTVSKVDTRTGRELGRYITCPAGGSPSRTTVDQQGNCWIINRTASTATKIGLYENGQYEDRNGNGIIETSQDLNGDGVISASEMLPWGKDECVLYEVVFIAGQEGTFVPGTYKGPWNETAYTRSIAVDARANVWVGTYNTKKYYYVSGVSGQILRTVDVSSKNHTPYGAVIDANGILWSAGIGNNHVLWLNPANDSFDTISIGHTVYGLALDQNNHLFISGWQSVKLSRFNVLTRTLDWTRDGISESRGMAVTDDGDVWVANSAPGTVARWSNDGLLKKQIPVGNTPTGVSVDADGKVWVVNYGDEYIKRIDPATDTIDISKQIPNGYHYGYSDMTGIISRTATTKFGRWTVIHNAKVTDTPWGLVSWTSSEPAGTSIKVRVRSSNDQVIWSPWENAMKGQSLASTPAGKYLQVEATFQVTLGEASPILYDLTVTPSGQVNTGQQIYSNNFQNGAGTEWSQTNVAITPFGNRAYLGGLGNTNLTLTLSQIPPHSAVTVAYDLFVLGSWDGNNTNDGPDRFEVNVGGGLKLVNSTFNNLPANSTNYGQAFPGTWPANNYPAFTGAAETNTLGFKLSGGDVMDAVYKQSYTFIHSSSTLVLNFVAVGLQPNLTEESWGLANVRVHIIPLATTAPKLTALRKNAQGQFQFRLTGQPDQVYLIQASDNLAGWVTIANVTLTGEFQDLVDETSITIPRRFYRAVWQQ